MEVRAARASLRAVPEGPGRGSAYRQVASDLRQAIAAGRYAGGQRLPTEAELVASTGLGRQTVRRAFQELVTEGVIYRVRGRGTFAVPGDGKYLRSFGSIDDLIADRARFALECGVDGIIASPQDNPDAIRRRLDTERLLVVTPGVRLAGAALDDHKRSGTPAQAIADGADYLVVGRPIVHSDDPAAMARRIIADMKSGG